MAFQGRQGGYISQVIVQGMKTLLVRLCMSVPAHVGQCYVGVPDMLWVLFWKHSLCVLWQGLIIGGAACWSLGRYITGLG
jgi:hypothetical protein